MEEEMKIACVLAGEKYTVGSMPPKGYLQWHEWAQAQHTAGLRQVVCGKCGKYKFPQELSKSVNSFDARMKSGLKIKISKPICLECNPR
jgi:hypothetical protein